MNRSVIYLITESHYSRRTDYRYSAVQVVVCKKRCHTIFTKWSVSINVCYVLLKFFRTFSAV